MIRLSKGGDIEENKKLIEENLQNGKALEKFIELVQNQDGDISYIENTDKFEKAKYIVPVISEKQGNIINLKAEKIGKAYEF